MFNETLAARKERNSFSRSLILTKRHRSKFEIRRNFKCVRSQWIFNTIELSELTLRLYRHAGSGDFSHFRRQSIKIILRAACILQPLPALNAAAIAAILQCVPNSIDFTRRRVDIYRWIPTDRGVYETLVLSLFVLPVLPPSSNNEYIYGDTRLRISGQGTMEAIVCAGIRCIFIKTKSTITRTNTRAEKSRA